jgi:hypothetical protein|tara:strand:+ start:546 stop:1004 length:459 start_codon:yes stop_codon:yes gene_type:complete
MVNICTAPDLYTAQLFEKQSVWVATLSTGEDVIQDDDREGAEPPSAWLRLGQHCKENDCYITDMYIQNGTNKIEMEKGADGYYFCKSAGGFLYGGDTIHSYIIGVLNEGVLRVTSWGVPQLTSDFAETRDVNDVPIECLITKKGALSGETKK